MVAGSGCKRSRRQPGDAEEADRHEATRGTTRLLSGGWSAAASGRLLSLRPQGRPHALTAAELAVSAARVIKEPRARER